MLGTWVSATVLLMQDHGPVLRLSLFAASDDADAFTTKSFAMARYGNDEGVLTGGYWQG